VYRIYRGRYLDDGDAVARCGCLGHAIAGLKAIGVGLWLSAQVFILVAALGARRAKALPEGRGWPWIRDSPLHAVP
jgi:hypothetical protein